MTMHPTLERLRVFADAQGGATHWERVAAHLTRCGECRQAVSWIRSTREGMRQATELTVPNATWQTIAARLQRGDIALVPMGDEVPRASARPRAAAIAIGLLVAGTA